MVFELLNARLRHAATLRTFIARHIQHDMRDAERDEKKVALFRQHFQEGFDRGEVEKVKDSLKKFAATTEHGDEKVLDMEEQSMVLTFRLMTGYLKELTMFEHAVLTLEEDAKKNPAILSGLDDHAKKEFVQDLKSVNTFFTNESTEIYNVMLRLARVMRDQHDALQEIAEGKNVDMRLRDLNSVMGQAVAENLRAKLSTGVFLRSKVKKITHNEKKETKHIDEFSKHIESLATKLKGKVDAAALATFAKEIRHDIHGLAEVVKKDEGVSHAYLEDTRFFLVVAVEHFFKISKFNLEISADEQKLLEAKFPGKTLEEIKKTHLEKIHAITSKTLPIMREAYQELHKLEPMRTESHKLGMYARHWEWLLKEGK